MYGGRTDYVGQDEGFFRLGNLHLPWQQLVEGFFDINMTKIGLRYFFTVDTKNAHCTICVFDKYAGFSQIRSHIVGSSTCNIHLHVYGWEVKIMIMAQISPDPTLTVENVTDVMEKVTEVKRRQVWRAVLRYEKRELSQRGPPRRRRLRGQFFNSIDLEILIDIYSSHSSEKEKTHACSDVYVNCHPESSWEHLTTLLYEKDELTAVDHARPFLPPRGKFQQYFTANW